MPTFPDSNFTKRVAAKWLLQQGGVKTAKASGKKQWGGDSVGLFIPLPKRLAKKFPSLGSEDTSPSHVTFLYIGNVEGQEEQKHLMETLKKSHAKWWPEVTGTLGDVAHFDHPDKDRRVAHVQVDFDKDLASLRHRIKQELTDAGIEVEDSFPEYRPHVTLKYMPGIDSPDWDRDVPQGTWKFKGLEVWGLPKVHKIKFGPSFYKVSDRWLRKRFLQAAQRVHAKGTKTAGWWALDGQKPPVDKGVLMNAIPGCDPADAAMYTGDDPADHTGEYLNQIDIIYRTVWGRPAHPQELQAVFNFCFRPIEDGALKLNEWFDEFIAWLGVPATKITWSFQIWDLISWFFLQRSNHHFLEQPESGYQGPPQPPNPDIWKVLDIVKEDLIRLNNLEYPGDTATGRKFQEAVVAKFDTMREYWLDVAFPSRMSDSDQRLVKRISEKWLKGCMR